MQPTALDITRQGDLGGQKVAMGVDVTNMAHIMSVLTDLYSDPELAVIREYSTNARDAHVEAGVTRPIEVVTPTSMSPYFKVKDFGLGLSVDDIENIYSKYGASTKRESNSVVGMLGLGCKSALTYTSQFQIVAVKDGVRSTVSVARIEDGTGVMEIVDTCATDESPSVEIIVPTKRYNEFDEKCRNFFQYWEEGTVLLNGSAPKRFSGDEVVPGVFLIDGNDTTDYIVMGGVNYPVENGGLYNGTRPWQNKFRLVAFVPIGSVAFTPSRESLNYNSVTNSAIDALRTNFKAGIQAKITSAISTAKTHADALDALLLWESRFPSLISGIVYQGAVIPQMWSENSVTFMTWKPGNHRYAVDYNRRQIGIGELTYNLVVTNFPSDKMSGFQRQKMRAWMDANEHYNRVHIFPGELWGAPWTDNVAKVDWSVVKKIRLNPSGGSGARTASGYRFKVVDDQGDYRDTDTLDTQTDIVYFSPADHSAGCIADAFSSITDEVQVVRLTRNRWAKFSRDFPTATYIETWLHARVKTAREALTQDDLLALGIQNYSRDRLIKLDETRIDDPELVKFILAAKSKVTDSPTRKALNEAMTLASNSINYRISFPAVETPLSNYPLVDSNIGYRIHEHVYVMLNACYAHEQAKKLAESIDDESAA